jgi:hypothetical protein
VVRTTVVFWFCSFVVRSTVVFWFCSFVVRTTVVSWFCSFVVRRTVVFWFCSFVVRSRVLIKSSPPPPRLLCEGRFTDSNEDELLQCYMDCIVHKCKGVHAILFQDSSLRIRDI